MAAAKNEVKKLLTNQPDDISHEELIRTLAFELMVKQGLKDSEERRTITNKKMKQRIKQWQS